MRTYLCVFLLIVLIVSSATVLFSQNATKDVVYLKNGGVVKGNIIEVIPEKSLKIQTSDGNVFVYTMSQIEMITKEAVQSNETPSMFGAANKSQQSRFSIFGGAALPLGDFAKAVTSQDIIDYLDYNTPIPFNGSAKTGFTAGLQFVTGGSIGWIINGSFSMVKMDLPSRVVISGETFKVETASWQSALALTGVKFGTTNSTGVNFFVAPLVGAMYGKSPEMSINWSSTINNFPVKYSETVSSASNIALAYGLAVQLTIADNFIIGAQYVFSEPKYELEDHYLLGFFPPISTYQNTDRTTKDSKKLNWRITA